MTGNGGDPQTKAFTWDEIYYSNMIQHEALILYPCKKIIYAPRRTNSKWQGPKRTMKTTTNSP